MRDSTGDWKELEREIKELEKDGRHLYVQASPTEHATMTAYFTKKTVLRRDEY